MITISAIVFLYTPAFKVATISIVNLQDISDLSSSAALSCLIIAGNIAMRVLVVTIEFIYKKVKEKVKVYVVKPYGLTTQYIIPHSETVTLAQALKHKGIQLIETRGTWPKQNMSLVRALFDYGILRNDKIVVNGAEVGVMDCISEYLINSEEGSKTELYGYALHIEVIGTKDGKKYKHVLYHTHPASDGSIKEWEGLRAYIKNVGIPMAVATQMIANGACDKKGILIPEDAFEPDPIFEALRIRGIEVHHTVEEIQ